MFHALLLTAETFDKLAMNAASAGAAGDSDRANAIFLPQFAAALPLFIRARAMVQGLNMHHAPAGNNHEGENMNATQSDTTFNRSVYRDFALFALAAIGVGLAISLTLATAVVLAAPDGDRTTPSVHAAAGPQRMQVARNGMGSHSLQHLLPTAPVPERAPG